MLFIVPAVVLVGLVLPLWLVLHSPLQSD